jgi:hypothetical protein
VDSVQRYGSMHGSKVHGVFFLSTQAIAYCLDKKVNGEHDICNSQLVVVV